MSQPLTIARPYARAAFEAATMEHAADAWARKLAFASEVAGNPDASSLFGDPRVGPGHLAALFCPDGEPAESSFRRFLALLADNHRLQALPEIAALFEGYKRDAERILEVEVTAAVPLTGDAVETLKTALQRRFGRTIELRQRLDPGVIGGAVINAGDEVIDGTVRGRLARLRVALTQ